MDFQEIVEKRYAVKKFNGEQLPDEKVDQLLEMIRFAPSSFGLQPYVIKIVTDQPTKEKLLAASWNQPQVTTCSHLLVFCVTTDVKGRIDRYEQMMKEGGAPEESAKTYVGMMRGFEEGLTKEHKIAWAQRQTYIALGNAMNGATALGFDSCPMEGFSPEEYSKILELPEHLIPTVVLPIGIAADEPRPKIRYSKEELFE